MFLPVFISRVLVLADRDLRELDPAQILDLSFQRQVAIAALLHRVLRIVNVEPFLNPRVDPEELHADLLDAKAVQLLGVNVLWNIRRQPELNIEPLLLKAQDRLDPFTRRRCLLVCRAQLIVKCRDGDLYVSQFLVKDAGILRDHRALRDD